VAIVEDNAGICQELRRLIERTEDLVCIGACPNVATALRRIPALAPDVLVMDIQLPDGSGIDCTARLKPLLPRTQILMFTICDDRCEIMRALGAGAVGYILKDSSSDEIIAAIRETRNGGSPLTGEVARKVIESLHSSHATPHAAAQLTQREQEVLRLLSQGYFDKQISERLEISLLTVNSHLKHIYAKMQVHSRTEAIAKYLK